MSGNGHYTLRYGLLAYLAGPICAYLALISFVTPDNATDDDGQSLEYLNTRLKKTHFSSLNHRESAHYTEINDLYGAEMLKKWIVK